MAIGHFNSHPAAGARTNGEMGNLVFGGSCRICGKWLEVVIEKPMTEKQRAELDASKQVIFSDESRKQLSITQGIRKISLFDEVAWENKEEIERLAKENDWNKLAIILISMHPDLEKNRARAKKAIERLLTGRTKIVMEARDAQRIEPG